MTKLTALGPTIYEVLEEVLQSYGLELKEATVVDSKGSLHRITMESDAVAVHLGVRHSFQGKGSHNFDSLSPEDKKLVRELVCLLDDHFISDTVWQELCNCLPNLPSPLLLRSFREKLDLKSDIFRTPGDSTGAQVSFCEELAKAIRQLAERENASVAGLADHQLIVKVEGDGCKISRRTSWTTLTFVLIRRGQRMQSHNMHRQLVLSEAPENYYALRTAFADVLKEVNQTAKQGYIKVDDINVDLTVCLGADLKFLLVVLGLQSASSKYPCPFCFATESERSSPSLPLSHFNDLCARTLDNLKKDCDSLSHGVQHEPLLQMEPALVVPDILHMKIRIVDRLLQSLVLEFEEFDLAAQVNDVEASKDHHVQCLVRLVRSCGVKFDVWNDEKRGCQPHR